MDKIQTTREMAIELGEIGIGPQWVNATERRISSRDRAIVERCKERLAAWIPEGPARDRGFDTLDSVLRELEGEGVTNV